MDEFVIELVEDDGSDYNTKRHWRKSENKDKLEKQLSSLYPGNYKAQLVKDKKAAEKLRSLVHTINKDHLANGREIVYRVSLTPKENGHYKVTVKRTA